MPTLFPDHRGADAGLGTMLADEERFSLRPSLIRSLIRLRARASAEAYRLRSSQVRTVPGLARTLVCTFGKRVGVTRGSRSWGPVVRSGRM